MMENDMLCVEIKYREVKFMTKTAIIYASKHHGNTYKLVEAISEKYDIVPINAQTQQCVDLNEYDLIGFASGIDFGKFYPSVEQFLKDNLPKKKKVFFLYTCAKTSSRFTESMKTEALKREAIVMGEYGCRGYNTYGPWKIIGGMNKNHPSRKELEAAVRFYETLMKQK